MCEILIAAGIVIVVLGATFAAFYFTGRPAKVDVYNFRVELADIKRMLHKHYDSSDEWGLYKDVCLRSLNQRLQTLEIDTRRLQEACEDRLGTLTVTQEKATCRFVRQARRKV